jgi:hypothetical protein
MSPEQLRGSKGIVDRRSDIYSLGVTLYELLALRLPFSQTDPLELRGAILEGAVRPLRGANPAVSRALEIVCSKALERDASRRYVDAAAFARDLRNVLEKRPIEARPAAAVLQFGRLIQRYPIAATVVAAAIALPSALWWQNSAHADELRVALQAARMEARHAHEINNFLVSIFGSLDPSFAQGKELSARDVLDVAANRLQTELAAQPLERSRLLTVIGETYSSLGEWERAEKTLLRAQELHLAGGSLESLEYMRVLRALATLESDLGRADALEHARTAAELHR